jgi:hypothetical protein
LCCPSLLAGGFEPTTHSGTPGGTIFIIFVNFIIFINSINFCWRDDEG